MTPLKRTQKMTSRTKNEFKSKSRHVDCEKKYLANGCRKWNDWYWGRSKPGRQPTASKYTSLIALELVRAKNLAHFIIAKGVVPLGGLSYHFFIRDATYKANWTLFMWYYDGSFFSLGHFYTLPSMKIGQMRRGTLNLSIHTHHHGTGQWKSNNNVCLPNVDTNLSPARCACKEP